MKEREDEKYVRELFAERYGVQLRRLAESKVPGVKTPDFEMLSEGGRIAVVEVKRLGRVDPTPENGWVRDDESGFMTRDDNSAGRVGNAILKAHPQLQMRAGDEARVLVFVNDSSMDFLDLNEALTGHVVYGSEEVGYFKSTTGLRVAEGEKIRERKHEIDLYIWINRYEGQHVVWSASPVPLHREQGKVFFIFGTDAGYGLARSHFGVPEVPKPDASPDADVPTLQELLLAQAMGKNSRE